jgi:hypothetical protein
MIFYFLKIPMIPSADHMKNKKTRVGISKGRASKCSMGFYFL